MVLVGRESGSKVRKRVDYPNYKISHVPHEKERVGMPGFVAKPSLRETRDHYLAGSEVQANLRGI